MQVWLHPVEMVVESSAPLPAVITRIRQVSADAGFQSQQLDQILNDACMAMPGNLEQAKGNYDPSAYASEVIHIERLRVGFYDRLRAALDEVAQAAGDSIDWCLPFVDYDINFQRHDRFIAALKKFPYLDCYLCVGDENTPLVNNWRNKPGVQIVTDNTLQIMAPPLGFPNPIGVKGIFSQPGYGGIHGLPPTPAAGNMLPSYSSVPAEADPWVDEDEETPKPKQQQKGKKQYRSIDDP